jgi:hypothetical protein
MQSLKNDKHVLTVITPTIGRDILDRQIESIDAQTVAGQIFHLVMWDEKRIEGAKDPESYNGPNRFNIVLPWGLGRYKGAPGSSLRAVALMAANTTWVTFADDDVMWRPTHAESMLRTVNGYHWAACLRHIYAPESGTRFQEQGRGEYLGVDRFESVGDDPNRNVPYEMIDNNCMIFNRLLGVHAAHLYRLIEGPGDDRHFYSYMKQHAGPLARTNQATIDHTCPDHLVDFFRQNCSKE